MRGGKHGADPQAVQRGRLRAAALSLWFSVLFWLPFSWRVLGCGGAKRRRTRLCQAHVTVPDKFFTHQSNQESV